MLARFPWVLLLGIVCHGFDEEVLAGMEAAVAKEGLAGFWRCWCGLSGLGIEGVMGGRSAGEGSVRGGSISASSRMLGRSRKAFAAGYFRRNSSRDSVAVSGSKYSSSSSWALDGLDQAGGMADEGWVEREMAWL